MNIYNTAMRKSTTLAAASYFARESVDEPFIDDEGYAQTLKDVIEIYGGVPAHIAYRLADVLDQLPRNTESTLDDAAWALDILVQTRNALNELLENDRTLMESAQEDKPLTDREKENIRREAAKFDADYLETTDEKNAEFKKGGDAYDHDGIDNKGTRGSFYGVRAHDVDAHENAIRANADNQNPEKEFLELHDVFTKPTDVAENKKSNIHENPKQPDMTCSESKDAASTQDVPPVVKTQSHEKTAESASAENASSEKSADEKDTPEKPTKAPVAVHRETLKIKVPRLAAISPGEAFKTAIKWTMNCLVVITTGSNVPDHYPRLSPIIGLDGSPLKTSDDVAKMLAELARKFQKLRAPDAGDGFDDVFDGLMEADPKDPGSMLDSLKRLTDRIKRATGGTKSEYDATGGEGMSFREGSEQLWGQDDDF